MVGTVLHAYHQHRRRTPIKLARLFQVCDIVACINRIRKVVVKAETERIPKIWDWFQQAAKKDSLKCKRFANLNQSSHQPTSFSAYFSMASVTERSKENKPRIVLFMNRVIWLCFSPQSQDKQSSSPTTTLVTMPQLLNENWTNTLFKWINILMKFIVFESSTKVQSLFVAVCLIAYQSSWFI